MDPFKKKQEEVTTQKFREALKKSLNKKKKPVRFTWKGLGNLGISLTTNPGLAPLRQKRLEELKAGNKANEKDYIDFFEDIEASFAGGVQDLGYSIEDIITTGIAGVSGNDKLLRDVEQHYEENKLRDTIISGIKNQIENLTEKSNTNESALDQSNQKIQSVSADVIKNQSNSIKISVIIFILIVCVLALSLLKSKAQNKKLSTIFENQINDSQKIVEWLESNVKNELNTEKIVENDHSFAKRIADEITRISLNLSLMDSSVRGHRQLSASVDRLKRILENNNYQIVELIGMKYHRGLNVDASFQHDENLEKGQSIITKIIKPQLNFNGKLIQMAQVEVRTNE